MNKLKKIFTIILFFFILFMLFNYNYIIKNSVILATNLWLTKVFPSLFIMFILNDIIINTNLLNPLNKFISPLFNKIFHVHGSSSLIFLLTIFSGTPSSAFIIKENLTKGNILESDANKLIAFTFFNNPLFLYNMLNLTFNKFITIKIIIISYVANIFIGLLFRNKDLDQDNGKINITNNPSQKLLNILPSAITKSLNTLLMILGTITFYLIITNIICTLIPFNPYIEIIFKGIIEITQSLNILPNLVTPSIIKEIIALTIISFGGLSIHTQILALISDTKISYQNFFIGRLYHVLISTSTYLFITLCIIG